MTVAVAILIAIIGAAIIGFTVYAVRSAGETAEQRVAASTTASVSRRPQPIVTDFHVRGETASVIFGVPLGDSDAGERLTDLLSAAAIDYVRTKVADGLPLDGVAKIDVLARRGDEPTLLATVDLPEAGTLPDESAVLMRDEVSHDPIAAVQAVVADTTVAAPSSSGDALKPVAEFIELSTPTDAHLRAIGIDTSTVSLSDLVVSLFRINGYQVEIRRSGMSLSTSDTAEVFVVSRDGSSSTVVVHTHTEGTHPELEDQFLAEFAVGVAQSNPVTAILVSDKFGPYEMYEREKRDKRLVLVTRERLQAFVDSFGLS